ncbi:MAG: dihydrofolate reductase [Ignavibacteriaceae bacterium]|nr:dihydrofolate reductase [Ignavibacteriaceae bacterium]
MKKIIISAVAKNGVIGKSSGEMSWHSKEEFQHFKSTTFGFPVIMGRVTFETLGKPLKGRLNVVITRNDKLNYDFEELKIVDSLNTAYSFCERQNYDKIFIIGGASIYSQAMETADEMIISIMDFDAEGDVYFPKIDENIWEVTSRDKRNGFEVLFYARKK